MIVSADTNLFLYTANLDSPHRAAAQRFFEEQATSGERVLLCGLVLVEIYMKLRNPHFFKKPKTAREATSFCDARLAFTLRHLGVTHYATANSKHFEGLGFERVWSPQ